MMRSRFYIMLYNLTDLKVVFKFFLVQLVCGFHLLKLLLQNLNTIKTK